MIISKNLILDIVQANISKYYLDVEPSNLKFNIYPLDTFRRFQPWRFSGKSFVVKIENKKENKRYYIFIKTNAEKEMYENYYHIWRLYYQKKNRDIDKYSIPRPLDYVDKYKIFITEMVSGVNLYKWLRKYLLPVIGSFNKNEVEKRIRESARWLAYFHNITYLSHKKIQDCFEDFLKIKILFPEEILRVERDFFLKNLDIEKKLKIIPFLDNDMIKRISKILYETQCETPITGCHGDFGLGNIIFTKNRVVVVDWDYYTINSSLYDLQSFLCGLERRSVVPGYPLSHIKRISNIFLDQYKKDVDFAISSELINITRALYLVRYLWILKIRINLCKNLIERFMWQRLKDYSLKELNKCLTT